jgi:hypothetical protein
MMRKLLFAVCMAASMAFASDINITLCQEKNYNCQVIPVQNVKNTEKVGNGTILRVNFANGKILDISILGKVIEFKKRKK